MKFGFWTPQKNPKICPLRIHDSQSKRGFYTLFYFWINFEGHMSLRPKKLNSPTRCAYTLIMN
jgi:hypothetical protein